MKTKRKRRAPSRRDFAAMLAGTALGLAPAPAMAADRAAPAGATPAPGYLR